MVAGQPQAVFSSRKVRSTGQERGASTTQPTQPTCRRGPAHHTTEPAPSARSRRASRTTHYAAKSLYVRRHWCGKPSSQPRRHNHLMTCCLVLRSAVQLYQHHTRGQGLAAIPRRSEAQGRRRSAAEVQLCVLQPLRQRKRVHRLVGTFSDRWAVWLMTVWWRVAAQCRHQDREEAIVKHSTIATVSLGATRRFCLRHDKTKRLVPVSISINGLAAVRCTCA